MISIIYFYDNSADLDFINTSYLCSKVLIETKNILKQLLEEISSKPLTPNNKSIVITSLMTVYLLKHLKQTEKYQEIISMIKANKDFRYNLMRIVKIGLVYFSEKPCDSIDL
jgi:hypothetical protein